MSKIEIRNLTKSYRLGHTSVEALRGIDLSIDTPEIIGIVGPSGSGKTTLLNILGGIDLATSGTVSIDEEEIGDLDDNARTALRRRDIGFIFQTFSLIPVLTALENVELPLMAQGLPKKERRERALALLKRVGLTREAYQRPDELSGGQRQRVAIARALIIKPRLVLADEPTANLDGENGRNVLELMHEMNHEMKTTFLLSTHDPRVLPYLDRRVYLEDGRITRIEVVEDHIT
ncbi:MAG TPA: ABC transporter ATP-binding protein [Rectinemataceae bacterium]|nr:ABC transporter ATP-binding protein [Rectinemataceae bacterium]